MQTNGPDYSTRDATRVIDEIRRERVRQIKEEGWTAEHDDKHDQGEIARAASCYAHYAASTDDMRAIEDANRRNSAALGKPWASDVVNVRRAWPWDWSWWKPQDRRRDLIRAAALIVAEIERLDRAVRKAA